MLFLSWRSRNPHEHRGDLTAAGMKTWPTKREWQPTIQPLTCWLFVCATFWTSRSQRMMYWVNLWLLPQALDNWEKNMCQCIISMDVHSARHSGWPKNNHQFISQHFKNQSSQGEHKDFWWSLTLLQLFSQNEKQILILFDFWIRNILPYKLFPLRIPSFVFASPDSPLILKYKRVFFPASVEGRSQDIHHYMMHDRLL